MKGYSSRDVAKLLDLSVAQVRAYARSGFLTPTRGTRGEYQFSFQDLVLMRAAKGLVAARIPATRIRRALMKLKEQLPRGRPLTEVHIAAEGDRIVVSDGTTAWNPESGQFHLDFAVSELCAEVAPLAHGAARAAIASAQDLDADAWHELGLDLEVCAPADACDAYRHAIELEPQHADAHVNLGRLLHEAGQPGDAETHYRLALAARPEHSTAAFNLGIALEDLGRPTEAIAAYERAIAADPECADAHFNLSRLHEQAGRQADALRHLKSYRAITENR